MLSHLLKRQQFISHYDIKAFSTKNGALLFWGVFCILFHTSSFYPAFVYFSSAAFPSNSLLLAAAALFSLCWLLLPESKLTSGFSCVRLCSWSFISPWPYFQITWEKYGSYWLSSLFRRRRFFSDPLQLVATTRISERAGGTAWPLQPQSEIL